MSAGKTTVLNALFRDKFGEVSMKRTTAGVNYFASPQLRQ
jgi:GTPase SAR1 family protein